MSRKLVSISWSLLVLIACGERPPRGNQASQATDTTRDRSDTTATAPASAADTQDGASLKDTTQRPRPTGMQRPEEKMAPVDKARADSAPRSGQ